MLNIFDEGALVGGVHKESFSHLRVHQIFGVGSYGAVIGVSVGRIARKILALKLSVGDMSLRRRAQLSFSVQRRAASSDLAPGALALYETTLASGTSLTAMVQCILSECVIRAAEHIRVKLFCLRGVIGCAGRRLDVFVAHKVVEAREHCLGDVVVGRR